MADDPSTDPKTSEQRQQRLAELNQRQRAFVHHLTDPNGPAYGNRTQAAEMARYAGEPGSVQLAVQGHRVANNPKVQRCLEDALEAAGCTPELDARCIREAMDAIQVKYIQGPNNSLISSPPQPNHRVRLAAVDLKHRLLKNSSSRATHQRPGATDSGEEQGERCAGCREAQNKAAALDVADRQLLRDIAKGDEALRDAEMQQPEAGKDADPESSGNPR